MKARRLLAYLSIFESFIEKDVTNYAYSILSSPRKEQNKYRRQSKEAHELLIETSYRALKEVENDK